MNFGKAILQDMVEKKLWPIALILVALMVGVPMYIAKPDAAPPVASVQLPQTDKNDGPELSLTRASTTGFSRAPRVSKDAIDPFGQTHARFHSFIRALRKSLTTTEAGATDTSTTATGGGGTVPDYSGGGTTDPGTTTNPGGGGGDTPTKTTPVKTETDDVLSVLVTPDGDQDPTELTDVRTLSPLPDADNPFLVYVGENVDGTAQFIVASNATPTGDGKCTPSPADCSTLALAVGDTETFVVTNTDNTKSPPVTTTTKVQITVTDLKTKKVPVDDGTTQTAAAARLEARTRAVGAKALDKALDNDDVVRALVSHKTRIRTY